MENNNNKKQPRTSESGSPDFRATHRACREWGKEGPEKHHWAIPIGGLGLCSTPFLPPLSPLPSHLSFKALHLGLEVTFYCSKINLFLHSLTFFLLFSLLSFPKEVKAEAERSRSRNCGRSLVAQTSLIDGWGESSRKNQPKFSLKATVALILAGFPLNCAGLWWGQTPLSQEERPWE